MDVTDVNGRSNIIKIYMVRGITKTKRKTESKYLTFLIK